uniref:Knottin scorpion toxin-like domain-containing protein n=1 Tax=Hordeum vulgare subsp. vulgare TaxID=112509 RepID=A0A8I6YNW0_HORVV
MAIGAWSAMKKTLLLNLSVCLLIIAMANCTRDIPESVKDHPRTRISETWGGGNCAKHGTCNKPCRAEGYDSGFCANFPFLTYCCCKINCGDSLRPQRSSFVCG